jgi:hypothetical protein
MPVAKNQLQELVEIILQELGPDGMHRFRRILFRFKHTTAYVNNKSFKETVDRLSACVGR